MKKRLLSISLTLCMIVANISALSVFALAEEAADNTAAPEVAIEQTQEEEAIEETAEEDNSAELSSTGESALSADGIKFLNPVYKSGGYNKGLARMEEWTCKDYKVISDEMFVKNGNKCEATLTSGWYIFRGNCDFSLKSIRIRGDVKIIIENGCEVKTGSIIVNVDNSLEIYGQEGNAGKLTCRANEAAGIGGDTGKTNGWITINGGEICVSSTSGDAAIGGSKGYQGNNIVINGGKVEAIGGYHAAGIGGGLKGAGYDIYINGGIVSAKSKEGGAGIGGGEDGDGHDIYINGGEVDANADLAVEGVDSGGAGIGGGGGKDGTNIYILGGKVTAKGGNYSCGIGGGYLNAREVFSKPAGKGSHIYIENADVTAIGQDDAAGIGSAEDHDGEYIYITNSTVKAWIDDDDDCSAAAIGGGENGSGKHIYITGSTVEAYAGSSGAGIGGGDGSNTYHDGGDADDIIIKDSIVTAHGDNGGAGIGGGNRGCATNITIDHSVIKEAIGRNGGAGIGSGYNAFSNDRTREYGYGDTIKIINGSNVTANGGNNYYGGAGIGGGHKSSGENITIEDSTVVATGGCDSAGIGGGEGSGDGVDGKNIIIKNSNVTATGEDCGAGIGGGEGGSGMKITIDNSIVTATSGGQAAGIGGGDNGYGNDISIINGSDVTAKGGGEDGGAGIGGGNNCSGNRITIKDSKVNATGGDDSAGIGGGDGSGNGNDGNNILIVDSNVYAQGDEDGAGIGGGNGGCVNRVTIQETKEGATNVEAHGGYDGAGIGGGNKGWGYHIYLEGGTVKAYGGSNGAAGLGGGSDAKANIIRISNTKLTAEGGNQWADGIGSGKGVLEPLNVSLNYEDGGDYYITCNGQPANFKTSLFRKQYVEISRNLNKSGKHTHKWTYKADGSTITATCSKAGHKGASQIAIQLSAPDDCTYDGTKKAIKVNGTVDGVKIPAVKYYKGSMALKKAPSAIGTYTAKLTLGKATASVTYTIAKAEDIEKYNANLETIEDIQLTQNAAVAAKSGKITVSWAAAEGYEMASYQVYRATSKNGKYSKVATVKAGTLKYVNAKSLEKGKTYYYKVRGVAKFGALTAYTRWSEVQSAKCRKTVK